MKRSEIATSPGMTKGFLLYTYYCLITAHICNDKTRNEEYTVPRDQYCIGYY